LLTDGNYTYAYDNEGNRTSRTHITTGEVTQYTWDYHNRLTSVITKDSSSTVTKSVEYTYDAYDRRIAKNIDSDGVGAAPVQTERMVYDGDNIALTFDGNETQTHRYLHGTRVDEILADETTTDVNSALTDNQGTVRDAIDSNGVVLNHLVYDSYGQVTSETNPNVDFRYGYTGWERDEETGLDYYRTRYYDSLVGRFVSEDTIGFNGGDTNLYRYVANSPLNLIDPNGTSWLNDVDAALSERGVDLYGVVNTLDQGIGGYASGTTGGATDIIREKIYGGSVNDNQHGVLHDIASGLGDISSSVVGGAAAKGGSRLVRAGAGLLRNANEAADIYGKGKSAYDIARGCGTPLDVLPFLPGGRQSSHGLNPRNIEFSAKKPQKYVPDLSHVTGKGAKSRQKAIDEIVKQDLSNLKLTKNPKYNPFIPKGVAKRGEGTQIGKDSFSSRNQLRDSIVHEELHHRWWKRGIIDHHPLGSEKEARFYKTVDRYMQMRGWKK
jgi:RHS repeat-associated protein